MIIELIDRVNSQPFSTVVSLIILTAAPLFVIITSIAVLYSTMLESKYRNLKKMAEINMMLTKQLYTGIDNKKEDDTM